MYKVVSFNLGHPLVVRTRCGILSLESSSQAFGVLETWVLVFSRRLKTEIWKSWSWSRSWDLLLAVKPTLTFYISFLNSWKSVTWKLSKASWQRHVGVTVGWSGQTGHNWVKGCCRSWCLCVAIMNYCMNYRVLNQSLAVPQKCLVARLHPN